MTWRWDDAAYDVAESHGQHVPGSLDSYDWDGFDAAGRILLAAIDSVLELLPPAPEGLTAGSSPARGHTQKEAGSAVLGSEAPRSAPASLCIPTTAKRDCDWWGWWLVYPLYRNATDPDYRRTA